MKRRRWIRHAISLVILGLVAGACGVGEPVAAPTPSDSHASGVDHPIFDYDKPFEGDRLNSYSEARATVSFTPLEPKNLGDPVSILVTSGERSTRALAFLFDDSTYGRVIVLERPLQVSLESYVAGISALPRENDKPGMTGTNEVVVIRGGAKALITTSEDSRRSDIRWAESGAEVLVDGPTLDRPACLNIAQGI